MSVQRRPRRRPLLTLLTLLGALALLPVATTQAGWTATTSATTSTGTGDWCATPNRAANRPNVYPLAQFPSTPGTTQAGGVDGPIHLLIVPVTNPGPQDATLVLRLWSCQAALPAGTNVKVTSWRRTDTNGAPVFFTAAQSPLGGLDHTQAGTLGRSVQRLHRYGTTATSGGGTVNGAFRSQYSWVVANGRSTANPGADPDCLNLIIQCTLAMTPTPTAAAAFPPRTGSGAGVAAFTDYPAERYWIEAGTFPVLGIAPIARPVTLAPYTGPQTSVDGRQVQWLAMEWWGTTPPADLAMEVLLQ